jgi:hypothetical protein
MTENALQPAAAPLLRPLGFGELFDRAITLYIRNFWPFLGIVLVMMVPLALLQFALDSSQSGQLASVLSQIQHPSRAVPPTLPVFTPVIIVAFVVALVAVFAVEPIVIAAVAFGVARIYSGRPVEFRECFAGALAHVGRLYGVLATFFLMAIGAYIALVVVIAFFAVAVISLATRSTAFAVAAGVIGIVALLALVAAAILFAVAGAFAIYGVVIEGMGVFESIGVAFSRVFSRTEIGRAILLSICAWLIAFTGQILIVILALVAQMAGLIWLDVLLKTLSSALVYPFSIIIIVVYYFDVRIRREGYDLASKLGQLTAEPPA